jgi:hypothetical protein
MGRDIPSTNARREGTLRPASDCRRCLRLNDLLALDFAPIDSLFASGYALPNGSDLPSGHAHSGWSCLQAKPCLVCEVEQAQVYVNVRDRRAWPGRTAEGGCSHMVRPSASKTRTNTSMNPKASTQA